MSIWNWLKQTPLWLVAPSAVLAVAVGAVVMAYEPLTFDPRAYEVQTASAAELETIDAAQLEAENAASTADDAAGTHLSAAALSAPSAAVTAAAKASAQGGLADGSWTGYAACGQGNEDDWKPYYIGVTVRVANGKVAGISNVFGSSTGNAGDPALAWDAAENQRYLDAAIAGKGGVAGVESQLAGPSVASGIDAVSGATYSSAAIFNAYLDALGKSAQAGGAEAPAAKAAGSTESGKGGKGSAPKAKGSKKDAKGKKGKKAPQDEADQIVEEVGALADGTWVGYAACGQGNDEDWNPYYVKVALVVKDAAVTTLDSIEGSSTGEEGSPPLNYDAAENGAYLKWAVEGRTRSGVTYAGLKAQIEAAIAAKENLSDIDVVSGATYSSRAIFQAYYEALKKSAAAGGATVDVPAEADRENGAKDAASGESPQLPSGEGANQPEADSGGGSAAGEANSDEGVSDGEGQASGASDAPVDPAAAEAARLERTGVPSIHGAFADGTYSGHALCGVGNGDGWSPYYLCVDIVVKDGAVVELSDVYGDAEGEIDPSYLYDSSENASYLNWAVNGKGIKKGIKGLIQRQLDAGAEIEKIDTVSGATYSCRAIYEAFAAAIGGASA